MFGRKKDADELTLDLSDFDEKDLEEIDRIKKILEVSEIIKNVARQSRIMPGGSLVTPNIIFATNRRIIKRDPTSLGLRSHVDSIPYSQINKVHLEKGMFTSELVFDVGQYESGDNMQVIQAIPKKKAEEILSTINQFLRSSQDISELRTTAPKEESDDAITLLKKRLAKGEISVEEFTTLKKTLES